MAMVTLRIGEVNITARVKCDWLNAGEQLVVNGQCFIIYRRYCTTGDTGTEMCMLARPVDWNSRPSFIDREFWEMMRKNANPDFWQWSGTFPEALSQVVIEEQRKARRELEQDEEG